MYVHVSIWENNVYAWLLKKTKNKSFQNKATKHILKMCPQDFWLMDVSGYGIFKSNKTLQIVRFLAAGTSVPISLKGGSMGE